MRRRRPFGGQGPPEARAELIARNEDRSRSLNERDARRTSNREGVASFRCECWQPGCTKRVALSSQEWQMVRAQPTQFVVAPGHVAENFEAVVEAFPRFWVVDKFGEAGEIARRLAHQAAGSVDRPTVALSPARRQRRLP